MIISMKETIICWADELRQLVSFYLHVHSYSLFNRNPVKCVCLIIASLQYNITIVTVLWEMVTNHELCLKLVQFHSMYDCFTELLIL